MPTLDLRSLTAGAAFNLAIDITFFALLQQSIVARNGAAELALPLTYGLLKAMGNYCIPYYLDRSRYPALAGFLQSMIAFFIFTPAYLVWTYAYHRYLWFLPLTVALVWASSLVVYYRTARSNFSQPVQVRSRGSLERSQGRSRIPSRRNH